MQVSAEIIEKLEGGAKVVFPNSSNKSLEQKQKQVSKTLHAPSMAGISESTYAANAVLNSAVKLHGAAVDKYFADFAVNACWKGAAVGAQSCQGFGKRCHHFI